MLSEQLLDSLLIRGKQIDKSFELRIGLPFNTKRDAKRTTDLLLIIHAI